MKASRLTWVTLYLFKYRRITPAIAKRELNISTRTFWRYIATLRDAGLILAGHAAVDGGGVEYVAFDPQAWSVR